MKINFQGYTIDTQKENDYAELSKKLEFLLLNYYPQMGITGVKYNYNANTNVAEIIIKRPAQYMLEHDWFSLCDSQLITALPEEYFYPIGLGKNEGSFLVIPYLDDIYVLVDSIKRYAMVYVAIEDVADIALEHTDDDLHIWYIGK